MMRYIYILGSNTHHYIGVTNNITRRIKEHILGKTHTTRLLDNIHLLGYFTKETAKEAYNLEKIIKRNGHIHHRLSHPTFIKNK